MNMDACMANSLCQEWMQCEMSSDNSGDPCAPFIGECMGDSSGACMPAMTAAQNDDCGDCLGNDLCNAILECVRENIEPGVCPAGGGGSEPSPAPPSGSGGMTAGCSVETLDTALEEGGYTTIQLKCELPENAANVYVLAGTPTTPMSFPAAYQVPAPFGSDMGAPNPAFIAFNADVAFDSYLTVGQEQADLSVSPGPGGADAVAAWGVSESVGIESTDGAIFYMNPDSGPASNGAMIFAQLTLASGVYEGGGTARGGLQGRSVGGGDDWQDYEVVWEWGAGGGGGTSPPPPTPSPPVGVNNCDGSPLVPATNQMIVFGCILHETVRCGYNSNNAVDDYAGARSAFDDCVTASGGDGSAWPYCSLQLEVAQGLNGGGSCPGGGNNGNNVGFGFHTIVPFTVACADTYHFRFHADYGRGGFIGVNDDAQLSNTQASSASGSATDIWGHVEVNDIPLSVGDHIFEGLGFEGCCDGAQEMDVRLPVGSDWIRVTTGANDALV